MEQINFKDIQTSSLGFGCTKLTDSKSRSNAYEILNTAFDLGVTHFDTARLYGFGESELILGEFIKNKRDKVTITTKIGLDPVSMPTSSLVLLKLAKNVVNRLPVLKKLIIKKTNGFVNRPELTIEKAAIHIDESLKKLQTDYIDILLLHEFDIVAANQYELIDFLNEKKKEGKIRHFGLGTAFKTIQTEVTSLNPFYEVVQIEHNLLKPNINQLSPDFSNTILTNAHSIFRDLAQLQKQLPQNQKLKQRLKKEADIHLSNAQNISRLLLAFNKYSNPKGISIFTSANNQNIKTNVGEWIKPTFNAEQVAIFSKLLHHN